MTQFKLCLFVLSITFALKIVLINNWLISLKVHLFIYLKKSFLVNSSFIF